MILEEIERDGWVKHVMLVQQFDSDPSSQILVIEFATGGPFAYPGRAGSYDAIARGGGAMFHALGGMRWPYYPYEIK